MTVRQAAIAVLLAGVSILTGLRLAAHGLDIGTCVALPVSSNILSYIVLERITRRDRA